MAKYTPSLILILMAFLLAACNGEPEVDVDATVAAALAATQTAAPTPTPEPTATPLPTATPQPTATPEPTATPAPTATPEPTAEPTAEPTEAPTAEPEAARDGLIDGVAQESLDDGSTRYTVAEDGFSIELPTDWQVADLNSMQFSAALDGLADANEENEIFGNQFFQNLVASGIRFYALNTADPTLLTSTPPSINIIRQELPIEFTLDEYVQLNVDQIGDFLDVRSEIEANPLTLGDNDAYQMRYSVGLNDPFGNPLELLNTQYLLIEDRTAYVVTLVTPVDFAEDTLAEFTTSAETFRLLDE